MLNLSEIQHLSREDIIKNGSIFSPSFLVEIVLKLLLDRNLINSKSVIADFGSGYGAFIQYFKSYGNRCFGTEFDYSSFSFLTQQFPNIEFYNENSLVNISREKYNLSDQDELIIVGNPPYNDVSSIYKKGNKGNLVCDDIVASRDFGISFLKAYNVLKAKYVCVLHPLAYLIKKTNFNSLGDFRNNYRLVASTVFSSKNFESIKKSNTEFPVVAALYEYNKSGMDFDYIRNFKFDIYGEKEKFCLIKIETIDGKIEKYPKKGKNNGLKYYTLRDMNALLRNASFVESNVSNGVSVSLDNLYQYSWLFFLKNNFNPKKYKYLFGNLSPLYTNKIENADFKNLLVSYAVKNCSLILKYFTLELIEEKYGKLQMDFSSLFNELDKLVKI